MKKKVLILLMLSMYLTSCGKESVEEQTHSKVDPKIDLALAEAQNNTRDSNSIPDNNLSENTVISEQENTSISEQSMSQDTSISSDRSLDLETFKQFEADNYEPIEDLQAEEKKGLTAEELLQMSNVDDKIEEFINSDEYVKASFNDRKIMTEDFLKGLESEGLIKDVVFVNDMFSFTYACDVLGGLMIEDFKSNIN